MFRLPLGLKRSIILIAAARLRREGLQHRAAGEAEAARRLGRVERRSPSRRRCQPLGWSRQSRVSRSDNAGSTGYDCTSPSGGSTKSSYGGGRGDGGCAAGDAGGATCCRLLAASSAPEGSGVSGWSRLNFSRSRLSFDTNSALESRSSRALGCRRARSRSRPSSRPVAIPPRTCRVGVAACASPDPGYSFARRLAAGKQKKVALAGSSSGVGWVRGWSQRRCQWASARLVVLGAGDARLAGRGRASFARKRTLAQVANRLRKKLLPWHESQTACAKNCYPGTSRKPLAQKIATLARVANRLRKKLLLWHESQTACAKNCYPGTSRKPLAQKIATLARVANRLRKKLQAGVQLSTRLIH